MLRCAGLNQEKRTTFHSMVKLPIMQIMLRRTDRIVQDMVSNETEVTNTTLFLMAEKYTQQVIDNIIPPRVLIEELGLKSTRRKLIDFITRDMVCITLHTGNTMLRNHSKLKTIVLFMHCPTGLPTFDQIALMFITREISINGPANKEVKLTLITCARLEFLMCVSLKLLMYVKRRLKMYRMFVRRRLLMLDVNRKFKTQDVSKRHHKIANAG